MRLPKSTLRRLHLKAGHTVEIRETAHGRAFSIIPVRTTPVSFEELVNRITKENLHALVDFGNAIGKEIW